MSSPVPLHRPQVTRIAVTVMLTCALLLGAAWAALSHGSAPDAAVAAPHPAAQPAEHVDAHTAAHTNTATTPDTRDCYIHCSPQETGSIAVGTLLITLVAMSAAWAPRRPHRGQWSLRRATTVLGATRASAIAVPQATLAVCRT